MIYALWNTDTGNRVGFYHSKEEALAEVRDAVMHLGREFALPWALVLHEGEDTEPIAEGAELIALALVAAL